MAAVTKQEKKKKKSVVYTDVTALEFSIKINGWRLKRRKKNSEHKLVNNEEQLDEVLIDCATSLRNVNLRSLSCYGFRSPIMMVIDRCPNILNVCTSEFLTLTPAELFAIAHRWVGLESLTISLIDRNTESGISELLNITRNLKYFALKNHVYVNEMRGTFFKDLPFETIEEINLTRCVAMIPELFAEVAHKFQRLRALTIKLCNFIDDDIIIVISKLKTLEKLYMDNIPSMSAHIFNSCIINLEYLEELSIPDNCWLRDNILVNISWHCRQIKLLDVSLCTGITDKGIASLILLKELEVLKMNWVFRVSDQPLGDLTHLKVLMCYGCHGIRDNGIMRLIKLAPYLTKLNLSQCSITNRTIETAIDVTNKRRDKIELELNVFDTDTCLSKLYPLEKSPLLHIIYTDITDSKTQFWEK